MKKIKLNEIELQDRNTVLRGIKNNVCSRTVSQVVLLTTCHALEFHLCSVDVYRETQEEQGREQTRVHPRHCHTRYSVYATQDNIPSADAAADPKMQAKKAKNLYPIIMISSSPTALITMHNVKRFLQESTFEPSQEARARAISEGNVKPDDMIPIYRKRTHIDSSGREMESHVRYVVVDSVEALSKFGVDPWDRVVCVMTTGQEWQFKNYKWKDPKQLFHHGASIKCLFGRSTHSHGSQGNLRYLGPRSTESENQGLERDRTQGGPGWLYFINSYPNANPCRSTHTGDMWTNLLWHIFGNP